MSKTHWVLDATFAGRGITSIGSKWKFSMIPVLPIPASKPILLVRKDWFWWHRLCTATKNAYLAQIISPEIKLSTEAIFYYKRFESTDSQFSNCDISESKRARLDPLLPKWLQRAGLSPPLSWKWPRATLSSSFGPLSTLRASFGEKTLSHLSQNVTTTCPWEPSLMPKRKICLQVTDPIHSMEKSYDFGEPGVNPTCEETVMLSTPPHYEYSGSYHKTDQVNFFRLLAKFFYRSQMDDLCGSLKTSVCGVPTYPIGGPAHASKTSASL